MNLLAWMVEASLEDKDTRGLTPEAIAMNILFLVSAMVYCSGAAFQYTHGPCTRPLCASFNVHVLAIVVFQAVLCFVLTVHYRA